MGSIALQDFAKVAGPIIALDLGRRAGWAYCNNGQVKSGVCELIGKFGYKNRFEDGERFAHFRRFLLDIDDAVGGFSLIAFEDVNPATHLSKRAVQLYSGFRGTALEFAATHRRRVLPIPVGTWKKIFTGSGSAKKEAVTEAARQRGFCPIDQNEADALGILHCAVKFELSQNLAKAA